MKKQFSLIVVISFFLTSYSLDSFSQDPPDTSSANRVRIYEYPDRPKHDFDWEIGGAGLGFSMNYGRRFIRKNDEFGIRIGIGIGAADSVKSALTVPLQGYYRLGKKKDRFEFGAGITYMHAAGKYEKNQYYGLNSFTNVNIPSNKNNILFPTANATFRLPIFSRYHPVESGRTDQYLSFGLSTFYSYGQFGLVPAIRWGVTF
jgi:hypothetical protein